MLNPYQASEVHADSHESVATGPIWSLLYVLGSCSIVLTSLSLAIKLFGEIPWLGGLFILSAFASALLYGITYAFTVLLAFGSYRWKPAAAGLIAGVVAATCAASSSLPGSVRAVLIPLGAAALASASMLRMPDVDVSSAAPKGSLPQWFALFTTGSVGTWLGVVSGFGKPILIALNQDVVGVMRSEQIEIAVTGGVAGGVCGVLLGIIGFSAIASFRSRQG